MTMESRLASALLQIQQQAPAGEDGPLLPPNKLGRAYRAGILQQHQLMAAQMAAVQQSGLHSFTVSAPPLPTRQFARSSASTSPIRVRELRMQKVHNGRHLLCRSVSPVVRLSSISFVVEDVEGNALRLALYNCMPASASLSQVQTVYAAGSVWRILHPFLKLASDLDVVLRVDDPQHLQELDPAVWDRQTQPSAPGGPSTLPAPALNTAEQCKAAGNAAFSKGDWASAASHFSRGLALDPPSSLRLALLANRAAAHLNADQFAKAETDTRAVLSEEPMHQKAVHRLLSAICGQRDWQRAKREKDALLQAGLRPRSLGKDVKRLLHDVDSMAREASSGVYDLQALCEELREQRAAQSGAITVDRLRWHATFLSERVDFGVPVPGKGRGVRARALLTPGQLLCACPAVKVVQAAGVAAVSITADWQPTSLAQSELLGALTRQMMRSHDTRSRVLQLYAGPDYTQPAEPTAADLDMDRVRAILQHNAFQACSWLPTERLPPDISPSNFSQLQPPPSSEVEDHLTGSSGLWLEPSYFNHSCEPNCGRVVLGDFMFVFCIAVVNEGDECCLAYIDTTQTRQERKAQLSKGWHFDCQCSACAQPADD